MASFHEPIRELRNDSGDRAHLARADGSAEPDLDNSHVRQPPTRETGQKSKRYGIPGIINTDQFTSR